MRISSLPTAVTWKRTGRDSNARPFGSRANALSLSPHSTTPTLTPTSSRGCRRGCRCRLRGMRALRHTGHTDAVLCIRHTQRTDCTEVVGNKVAWTVYTVHATTAASAAVKCRQQQVRRWMRRVCRAPVRMDRSTCCCALRQTPSSVTAGVPCTMPV